MSQVGGGRGGDGRGGGRQSQTLRLNLNEKKKNISELPRSLSEERSLILFVSSSRGVERVIICGFL